MKPDNIVIEGGVRIKNIEVVGSNTHLDDSDPDLRHVLTVDVNTAGDFSYYILRLVTSATESEPPENFDPQLSTVEFSFKANCPSEFDCKTKEPCLEEKISDPRIDYLAKDYASFRRLILDRLSLLMPDWKERNVADLQIALVEMMAYTGDHLSYYQDAVATEAYLFKARKRVSARRHARLLDYHVHNGCNSRTWISLQVQQGSNADGSTLAKGTKLLTKNARTEVIVKSEDLNKKLHEKDVEVFETRYDVELRQEYNKIYLYTWDDSECCLPRGATSATLDITKESGPKVGQTLLLEEIKGAQTANPADADKRHRHVVRLKSVMEKEDKLHHPPNTVLEVEWHEADALPFPLCISAEIERKEEHISVARGNIVLADHGITIENQDLIPKQADSESLDYRPHLEHDNITVAEPYDHNDYSKKPASGMLHQDPQKAIPEIELNWEDEPWLPERDLLSSDRFAPKFVVEIESDHSVQLRFGDDVLGKRPDTDFQPVAKYRIGNGPSGNVGAESIGRIVWDTGGILKVRNPLPARGGKNSETIEQVRNYAPEAFRTQKRAVTEADYAVKTELDDEVQKAQAKFRWTGSWYTVFLTIDRKNGLGIDPEFKTKIYRHLEKYRMAGYDLEIRPPLFVPLEIEMNVCVNAGYFKNDVKEKLLDIFSRFDLPDGTKGFFHPDEFTFGQPVYISAIYERAMQVDGIGSVEMKNFQRWARAADREIQSGFLRPGDHEIIRLDNDPNLPENGKITFLMYGGL